VDTYSAFLRRQQARGPQIVAADVRWQDAQNIHVGDHVLGEIPWVPDPVTNRRGGTRVYQVQGVQQRGGLVRLTLLDLGGNAFAQQPTASAIAKNAGAPYDAVDVTLTVPSGVIADVWTAETSTSVSTRPPDTSPLWRPKVQSGLGQNGVYTARDHAAGSRVWIRYRGIPSGQDKLPSPWRYPTNDGRPVDYVDLDARPEFLDVQVAAGDGPGEVDVAVRTNTTAKGVRVEYGPTTAYGSVADLNTSSGSAQTTLSLPPGSLAHLRLTAYPQFPIGGTAGEVRGATVEAPAAPASPAAPIIDQIQVTPVGSPALARSDVSFRVVDPTGVGGTLRAWLPGAGGNPNPTAAPAATLAIASTPSTVGPADVWTLTAGGTGQILNDLWSGSHYQPYMLVEFVSSTGASTGQVQIFLPPRHTNWPTGQPTVSPQNLLGPDAGPEKSGTGSFPLSWLPGPSGGTQGALSLLGLQVGDVVSGSVDLRSADGGQVVLLIQAYAQDNTLLAGIQSNVVASTSYQRATAEGLLIPAGTHYLLFRVQRLTGSASQPVFGQRAMLNRGPIALAFEEPPVRALRELRSPDNTTGIALGPLPPQPSWTTYIDLAATGAEPVLKHPQMELRADGTAVFSGELQASAGWFGGEIRSGNFTASDAVFSSNVEVGGNLRMQGGRVVFIHANQDN
ncbi:MAG TPA: hypothetical protein VIL71_18640, partial [Spirillospora sp.]